MTAVRWVVVSDCNVTGDADFVWTFSESEAITGQIRLLGWADLFEPTSNAAATNRRNNPATTPARVE